MPGLLKIGLTTRNPQARIAELTAATGVPSPFVLAWCRAVSDCGFVEATVHRMLADRRVSGRREFFRCEVATARQVIEAAAGGRLGRHYRAHRIRRQGRQRGRGKRQDGRGNGLTLALLGGVAVLLVLLVFKPPVGWLPEPLAAVALSVERLGSPRL